MKTLLSTISFFFLLFCVSAQSGEKPAGLIPYPQQVTPGGQDFLIPDDLTVVLDPDASDADRFAAEEFISLLKTGKNITAHIGKPGSTPVLVLTRKKSTGIKNKEGYQIITERDALTIRASGEAGLFYGVQTVLQLIQKNGTGYRIPGVEINDWPDVEKRAIHYDTKHHQDKASYVKSFIRDLSRVKVNMLVWEWEDKFAYPSHPEIGAPGAFTLSEMQEFTRYASKYHIQIVPLVQGLGHVSFILKWPVYAHLREIPASNWEFCPLKDESYDLLSDLWKDAMEATPGSEYIHIGSDETYELGECDLCRAKSEVIGKSGVYQLFINRSATLLTRYGRKVMAWEPPMGWKMSSSPARGIEPVKGLVFTESYDYETPEQSYAGETRKLGFEVFAYDPNPGVVPLMVPYAFEKGETGNPLPGSLEKSYRFLSPSAKSGVYNGMICTSWDDDGLHNQMWMLHFINAANWSWNADGNSPEAFEDAFYRYYYAGGADMKELFQLLNEGAYYFAGTFERNVWHYGEIGKTHLPDLPRGDAIEYDPYWNTEYTQKVNASANMIGKMDRALEIIRKNLNSGISNSYDLEIMRSSALLIRHTCLTYLDLSNLERAIRDAHVNRFVDYSKSVDGLKRAQHILENSLQRRDSVYNELVRVYEISRLPKGLSLPGKAFFWQQDRARHFAFRKPDMTFLICDEQKLGMEDYLLQLKSYIAFYTSTIHP
jgi:hypothetical protein